MPQEETQDGAKLCTSLLQQLRLVWAATQPLRRVTEPTSFSCLAAYCHTSVSVIVRIASLYHVYF